MTGVPRLDARVAFIGVIVLSISVFIVKDLLLLLLLMVLVVVLSVPHREVMSRYRRGVKGLLMMLVLLCFAQALLVPGEGLLELHLFGLRATLFSMEGLVRGGRLMARVSVLLCSSILFASTVEEGEFMDALLRLNFPYPVVFSVNLVLRMLPRLMEDAATIREAYRMRLPGPRKGGYISRWRELGSMVKPLFVASMVSAHRSGTALELRGFDGRAPWAREAKSLTSYDMFVLVLLATLLIASIVLSVSVRPPSALLQDLWAE